MSKNKLHMLAREKAIAALTPATEALVHAAMRNSHGTTRCRKLVGTTVITSTPGMVTCPHCKAGTRWGMAGASSASS